MMDQVATLSLATASIHLDPNQEQIQSGEGLEDQLLRASIRRHGVLEALQVATEGRGEGYTIIDGERRFRIAKEMGIDRLVCIVHPAMSREHRADLRAELRSTVRPAP